MFVTDSPLLSLFLNPNFWNVCLTMSSFLIGSASRITLEILEDSTVELLCVSVSDRDKARAIWRSSEFKPLALLWWSNTFSNISVSKAFLILVCLVGSFRFLVTFFFGITGGVLNWTCLLGDTKSRSSDFPWKNVVTNVATFFVFWIFEILPAFFRNVPAYVLGFSFCDAVSCSCSDNFLLRSFKDDGDGDGDRSFFGLKGFEKNSTICGGAFEATWLQKENRMRKTFIYNIFFIWLFHQGTWRWNHWNYYRDFDDFFLLSLMINVR